MTLAEVSSDIGFQTLRLTIPLAKAGWVVCLGGEEMNKARAGNGRRDWETDNDGQTNPWGVRAVPHSDVLDTVALPGTVSTLTRFARRTKSPLASNAETLSVVRGTMIDKQAVLSVFDLSATLS